MVLLVLAVLALLLCIASIVSPRVPWYASVLCLALYALLASVGAARLL